MLNAARSTRARQEFFAFLTTALCLTAAVAARADDGAGSTNFVDRNGTRLTLKGDTFYFTHANNYYLWYKPAVMVDEILNDTKAMGLTAVRLFAFCEAQDKDGFCFQKSPGVYDAATVANLDAVVAKAKARGLRLMLTLVNNWDDSFGGMRQYVNWAKQISLEEIPADLRASWLETIQLNQLDRSACSANPNCDFNTFQRYHDLFYTNSHARQLYKDYVAFIVNRYKNDPTILLWELANEPRAESDPSGQTLGGWINEMAAFIKLRDPHHLVSTGEEGWFKDPARAAAGPSDAWRYDGSLGVDFIAHHQSPWINVCTFHLLPNDNGMDEQESLSWLAEHAQACHQQVGKPVYVGEFAWKVNRRPRETVLNTFTQNTEGWRRGWDVGFTADSPQWVPQPAYDGNGAIQFHTDPATFAPNSDGGGAVEYPDAQLFDARGFDWLSGLMLLPVEAPNGLLGDFFTQSGPNWEWRDSSDVPLAPGTWHRMEIPVSSIADPGAIHRIGMRLKTVSPIYDGVVWYDRVLGLKRSVDFDPNMMADRNRIFADWRAAIGDTRLDGTGFWFLNGMLADGVSPHPDDGPYTIYYPEDAGTDAILSGLASDMKAKSGVNFRLWENCEGGRRGEPATSYSDATGFQIVTQHVAEGQHACELAYDSAKGNGKAYWEFANLSENWVDRPKLFATVYSPVNNLRLSVVVSTGPDLTWHESVEQNLRVGWNAVVVDLRASNWKTQASNWENRVPIENLNQIQRLSFGLFGYNASGKIWLDNIQLTALPRVIGLRVESGQVRWDGVNDVGRPWPWLTFSYRVDAGNWSPWSSTQKVALSSLAAAYGSGEKTFQVRVRDLQEIVSDPETILVNLP